MKTTFNISSSYRYTSVLDCYSSMLTKYAPNGWHFSKEIAQVYILYMTCVLSRSLWLKSSQSFCNRLTQCTLYPIQILWEQKPPCFSYGNDAVLMLISRNLHNKSTEVSIKTRSTPASLSFNGQATKHTTVKWSIIGFLILQCRDSPAQWVGKGEVYSFSWLY